MLAACEQQLLASSTSPGCHPVWFNAVFDLACALGKTDLAHSLAVHSSTAAQRSAASHSSALRHVLSSDLFGGSGLDQLGLLRRGHEEAWGGQGSEMLLLNVVLEVYEVVREADLGAVLEQVR